MNDDIHKKHAEVLDALRAIEDPGLEHDMITLNMVKALRIEGGQVGFDLQITPSTFEARDRLQGKALKAVEELPWAEEVKVNFTSPFASRMQELKELRESMKGVSHVVAVASGKGGVGKSTLSVNLALALSSLGAKVGLLDADAYGPSLPQLTGVQGLPQVSEDRKMTPLEKHGLKLMSLGFLVQQDEAIIWRGPMVHSLITQFLRDVEWGELDYLVVDLPPGTGDAQLTLTQSIPLAGAVVVTTPQTMARNIAARVIGLFRKMNVRVLGVVENMSYFICDRCGTEHDIFDRGGGEGMAARLKVQFLGAIPLDPAMRKGDDAGEPIVAYQAESRVAQEFVKVAEKVMKELQADEPDVPTESER